MFHNTVSLALKYELLCTRFSFRTRAEAFPIQNRDVVMYFSVFAVHVASSGERASCPAHFQESTFGAGTHYSRAKALYGSFL